jgi:hypothetical protein
MNKDTKKALKKVWNVTVDIGSKTAEWGFGIGMGILTTTALAHVSKEINNKAKNYKLK